MRVIRLMNVAIISAILLVQPVVNWGAMARGPESLSGLAEQVMDAVVNISASTNVPMEQQRSTPMPQLPVMTVVVPCCTELVSDPSQQICAS